MNRLALRAEAHAIAAVVRVALRLVSLPRLVALLERLPRAQRSVSAADCASAAAEAARRVAHPTCLFTALTAFALLARYAHAPRFVVGAAPDSGFTAHAWVTVRGRLLVPCTRTYLPLWSGGAQAEAS